LRNKIYIYLQVTKIEVYYTDRTPADTVSALKQTLRRHLVHLMESSIWTFWRHLVHWIAYAIIFWQMWKDILGFELRSPRIVCTKLIPSAKKVHFYNQLNRDLWSNVHKWLLLSTVELLSTRQTKTIDATRTPNRVFIHSI